MRICIVCIDGSRVVKKLVIYGFLSIEWTIPLFKETKATDGTCLLKDTDYQNIDYQNIDLYCVFSCGFVWTPDFSV